MRKVSFTLDDDVHRELVRLVPPRMRSRVVNEALRRELLRRRRQLATDRLMRLRDATGTLRAREILDAVRRDRKRGG
jgi:predicted transcriptional regulator